MLFFSAFQNKNQHISDVNSSVNSTISPPYAHPSSSLSVIAGSTSLTSDYGSDTAYETSEIGTPSLGRDNNSEVGKEEDLSLDEDLTSPIEKLVKYGLSNIGEGLFTGQAILEQLEGFSRHKVHTRDIDTVIENYSNNGNASKAAYLAGGTTEILSGPEHGKVLHHARKHSAESIGSDMSSQRESESSNSAYPNSFADGPLVLSRGAEVSKTTEISGHLELQFPNDLQLVLPLDQRQKMNRYLLSMQQRLVTAKTDMEDLISRFHQEIAVKDYLSTKVNDLEVELETTKQKSKEKLQQAILIERERFTQMQWDMEELRHQSLEMELKIKSEKGEKPDTESTNVSVVQEKDLLLQELHASKQQLEDLLKGHQELEVKSKADIKVLVKEVKSLRSSKAELRQQLDELHREKSEAEVVCH
ncbi:unnamed protein product [Ilex paraguariensis]|uniref:Uncharacterized protein n=1 Tax=Ilex paraguariensis TaxID=185542 RepID=A0ABC8SBM9_9AQUA